MKKMIRYIFQDWSVNRSASIKSSLVLALFRLAQLATRSPRYLAGLASIYGVLYQVLVGWLLGIELPSSVQVGQYLKLRHGVALVVHRDTVIGDYCTLRHSTTIGNKQRSDGSFTNAPKIGNHVDIGANVVILGAITIGDHAVIGAGAVVVKDVPSGAVVAGNPAKILGVVNQSTNHETEFPLMMEV